jgi:hypothetical protein
MMAIDERELFAAVELEMSTAFRGRLERDLFAAASMEKNDGDGDSLPSDALVVAHPAARRRRAWVTATAAALVIAVAAGITAIRLYDTRSVADVPAPTTVPTPTASEAPPGNRPPEMDPASAALSVDIGKAMTITADLLANDDDAGDHLVFTSVTVTPGYGTISFQRNTDTITYSAPGAGSADRTPVADTLDVTISDGNDGNVHGSVSIKINDTTPIEPPPVVRDLQTSAFVGDTFPVDVANLLKDANTTPLTLTGASVASGPGTADVAGGVAFITATGAGTIVVDYTVTNAGGQAKSTITVTASQRLQANPPVAADDTMTVASGGTASIDLLANDAGIGDPGDKVSAQLLTRPPASFGTVQLLNGVLSFVAAANASGLVRLQYSLTDGVGPTSTAFITFNVLVCGESPPNATLATIFTPYATPISIDLNQYVLSGHIRDGSVSGAGLTGATGVYTPPPGMNGSEVVNYIVENGCRQTFDAQLTVEVNGP